jgi:hypothetical protein
MAQLITICDKFSKNFKFLSPYIYDFNRVTNICPNGEEFYVCPLSRRVYAKSLLDKKTGRELTREHVPPESLGGKDICLTAKDINNSSTYIDICVKERTDRIVAYKLGKPQIYKGKLDDKFNIEMEFDAEKSHVTFKNKKNARLDEIYLEKFEQQEGEISFSAQLKGESLTNSIRKGYLKILYLITFSKFGNTFLYNTHGKFNPVIKYIIDLITSKDDDVDIPYVYEYDYDDALEGFNTIVNKEGKFSLFVCIRISEFNKILGILPWPDEANKEFHFDFIKDEEYFTHNMKIDSLELGSVEGALYYWGIWRKLPTSF